MHITPPTVDHIIHGTIARSNPTSCWHCPTFYVVHTAQASRRNERTGFTAFGEDVYAVCPSMYMNTTKTPTEGTNAWS